MSKEKFGIRKEKYLKVQSEPAVRPNPADYSGTYAVPDMDFGFQLQVNHDGTFDGTGFEPRGANVGRTLLLKKERIKGGFLRARKVSARGEPEASEAASMNGPTSKS